MGRDKVRERYTGAPDVSKVEVYMKAREANDLPEMARILNSAKGQDLTGIARAVAAARLAEGYK